MRRVLVGGLLLLTALTRPALAGGANVPEGGWRSPLLRDHELVGRVWSAERGLTPTDFRLTGSGCPAFLLLGEVHDNPDHHLLQARLLDGGCSQAEGADRAAIVFEQIRTDQQATLEAFQHAPAGGAGPLLRALDWDSSGWPPAAIYAPLFAAAIEHHFELIAGDAPRGKVRAIARGGKSMLQAEERSRLRLDDPFDPALRSALAEEIAASHCGLLPEAAFGGMVIAQRYRDAHLADAMISARHGRGTVVLIAGNGHVRTDRGVPLHLREREPARKIVSVLILEVEEGHTDPEHYVPRDPEGKPAVDWIVFTPRTERPDPCVEMKKQMGGG